MTGEGEGPRVTAGGEGATMVGWREAEVMIVIKLMNDEGHSDNICETDDNDNGDVLYLYLFPPLSDAHRDFPAACECCRWYLR